MPGKKSYGTSGKWVHDRAHKIMDGRKANSLKERYGEEKGKSVAYAIATQQAHKVKKSPKGHQTKMGLQVAKAKYNKPLKEYMKTAGSRAEAEKRVASMTPGELRRAYEYMVRGDIYSPIIKGRGIEEGGGEAVSNIAALKEKVKKRSKLPAILGALGGGAGGALFGATGKAARLPAALVGGGLGALLGGGAGYMGGKAHSVHKALAPFEHAVPEIRSHAKRRLYKTAGFVSTLGGKAVGKNTLRGADIAGDLAKRVAKIRSSGSTRISPLAKVKAPTVKTSSVIKLAAFFDEFERIKQAGLLGKILKPKSKSIGQIAAESVGQHKALKKAMPGLKANVQSMYGSARKAA